MRCTRSVKRWLGALAIGCLTLAGVIAGGAHSTARADASPCGLHGEAGSDGTNAWCDYTDIGHDTFTVPDLAVGADLTLATTGAVGGGIVHGSTQFGGGKGSSTHAKYPAPAGGVVLHTFVDYHGGAGGQDSGYGGGLGGIYGCNDVTNTSCAIAVGGGGGGAGAGSAQGAGGEGGNGGDGPGNYACKSGAGGQGGSSMGTFLPDGGAGGRCTAPTASGPTFGSAGAGGNAEAVGGGDGGGGGAGFYGGDAGQSLAAGPGGGGGGSSFAAPTATDVTIGVHAPSLGEVKIQWSLADVVAATPSPSESPPSSPSPPIDITPSASPDTSSSPSDSPDVPDPAGGTPTPSPSPSPSPSPGGSITTPVTGLGVLGSQLAMALLAAGGATLVAVDLIRRRRR